MNSKPTILRIIPVCIIFLVLSILSCEAVHAFSFAVTGDNRDGEIYLKEIIKRIKNDRSIKFVVNCGDLVARGSHSQFDRYKQLTDASGLEFHNVIGNHDVYGNGRSKFVSLFGDPDYCWYEGGCLFIVMDNLDRRGPAPGRLAWLKGLLKENPDKPKFVFMHKPLFDISGSYPDEVMRPRDLAGGLMELFGRNNVKAVFSGHVHGYARQDKDGVLYVIAGGCGVPLHLPAFSGGFHNYVKITVNRDGSIKDEVIRID